MRFDARKKHCFVFQLKSTKTLSGLCIDNGSETGRLEITLTHKSGHELVRLTQEKSWSASLRWYS